MNKQHQKYKSLGLCRRCGKIPVPGKTRCDTCHKAHLEYSRNNKAKAIQQGLCRHCLVNPKLKSNSMCQTCLDKHRAKGKENYQKLRTLCIEKYGGKCACCGSTVQKYFQLDHVNNDGSTHRKVLSGRSIKVTGGCLYK